MKKLIALIIVAGLALAMQAQNITNTLGTGGFYQIGSISGTEIISFGSISYGSVGLTLFSFSNEPGFDTDLTIQNNGTTNLFLNLMKARGIAGALENVENGDVLGTINFEGYHGSYQPSATISAVVTGAPGSHVPGELLFKTATATTAPETRMTISPQGSVIIKNDLLVGGRPFFHKDVTAIKKLKVQGSLEFSINSPKIGDTTLDNTHYTIFSTKAATVTLPELQSQNLGRIYIIKSAGVTTIVATYGNQTIDGSTANISIPPWKYIRVQSTGAAWIIIGGNYQ